MRRVVSEAKERAFNNFLLGTLLLKASGKIGVIEKLCN